MATGSTCPKGASGSGWNRNLGRSANTAYLPTRVSTIASQPTTRRRPRTASQVAKHGHGAIASPGRLAQHVTPRVVHRSANTSPMMESAHQQHAATSPINLHQAAAEREEEEEKRRSRNADRSLAEANKSWSRTADLYFGGSPSASVSTTLRRGTSPQPSSFRVSHMRSSGLSQGRTNQSPGSPTSIWCTRQEHEKLLSELRALRETNYDVDSQNVRLQEEIEHISLRLAAAQDQLQSESESGLRQSRYADSISEQLTAEQAKVRRLKKAVDMMEAEVHDLVENQDKQIRNLEQEKDLLGKQLTQLQEALDKESVQNRSLRQEIQGLQNECMNAKHALEDHEHLMRSKRDMENILFEVRQLNIAQKNELQGKENELENVRSTSKMMQQKIESLEKAGSLQVKHLDAISESEEELKRKKTELEVQLKEAADENRGLQEQLSQAAIDMGTMTQMALQLQALDDQNRALREEIATTQDRAGSRMIEIGLQNDTLMQENAQLQTALGQKTNELQSLCDQHADQEKKLLSQRDILSRQSEVLRAMQARAAKAEQELAGAKAENVVALNNVMNLQQKLDATDDESREVRRKAVKASELNSTLLALLSQLVMTETENKPGDVHANVIRQMQLISASVATPDRPKSPGP